MPRIMRCLIVQSALGFGLAALFVGMLLALDIANLGHLVLNAPGGVLAAILFWIFNGSVFSAVQFGIALTGLADERDDPGSGA